MYRSPRPTLTTTFMLIGWSPLHTHNRFSAPIWYSYYSNLTLTSIADNSTHQLGAGDNTASRAGSLDDHRIAGYHRPQTRRLHAGEHIPDVDFHVCLR